MKYVLMFCADGDDVQRFTAMSARDRAAQYERVGAWFEANNSKIIGGSSLKRASHCRPAG